MRFALILLLAAVAYADMRVVRHGVAPAGGGTTTTTLPPTGWDVTFGEPSMEDVVLTEAVDGGGNVYAAGTFWGTMTVGGTTLVSAGRSDGFVVKRGPDGTPRWARRVGGVKDDTIFGMAVDALGDVAIVGGSFADPVPNAIQVIGTVGTVSEKVTAATTSTITVGGGGVAAGHSLLVEVALPGNSFQCTAVTDSQGNRYQLDRSTGGTNLRLCWFAAHHVRALTAGDTITATHTSAALRAMSVVEVAGLGGTVDHSAQTQAGVNTTPTATAVAPDLLESADELYFGGTALRDDVVDSWTAGGSFTVPAGSDVGTTSGTAFSNIRLTPSSRIVSPGTSAAASATIGTASEWLCGFVAYPGVASSTDWGSGAVPTAGDSDIIIAKLSGSDGSGQWSRAIGGYLGDVANAVAIDPAGNLIVTGFFQSNLVGGGGSEVAPVDFGGPGNGLYPAGWDLFLASYTAGGAYRWAKNFPSAGNDIGTGLAVDAIGNVVLVGTTMGRIDFGTGLLITYGLQDTLIASFVDTGSAPVTRWARHWGGAEDDEVAAVAVEPGTGHVYAGGWFANAASGPTADFGAGPWPSGVAPAPWWGKYDRDTGAAIWARRAPDSLGQGWTGYTTGIRFDSVTGTVVAGGRFMGTLDFGQGNLTSVLASPGQPSIDMWLTGSNATTGAALWQRKYGSTGGDRIAALATDGSGNVVPGGSFGGTVDFGHGPRTDTGNRDVVVFKTSIPPP